MSKEKRKWTFVLVSIALFLFMFSWVSAQTEIGTSSIIRGLSADILTDGETLEVTLKVNPEKAAFYSIDEIYPSGWTVIDKGGLDDAHAGHLKVVVLDPAKSENVFIYRISPPAISGTYDFSGIYQMDGMKDPESIGGTTQIKFVTKFGGAEYSKADFVSFFDRRSDYTFGWTIYRFCNPTTSSYEEGIQGMAWLGDTEYLKSWRTEFLNEYVVNDSQQKFKEIEHSSEYPNGSVTTWIESIPDGWIYRTKTVQRWESWNGMVSSKEALQPKCVYVRVWGSLKPVLGERTLEHIPTAFGYTYKEYDTWNESWVYAMKVNLNSSQPVWGVQVPVNITKQVGMKDDYSDLRVLTNNTPEAVELWSCNETQNSHDIKLWVNLTLPNKNMLRTNGSIYLVWGNPSARPNFDCNKTYMFWEDWEDYTAGSDMRYQGGWCSHSGTPVLPCSNQAGKYFSWAYDPFNGARNVWYGDESGNYNLIHSIARTNYTISSLKTLNYGVIGYRYIYNGTSDAGAQSYFGMHNGSGNVFLRGVGRDAPLGANAIDNALKISGAKDNSWYRVNITWFNTTAAPAEGTRVCFSNSTQTNCKWKKWYTAGVQAPKLINLRLNQDNSPTAQQRYDNIFVANTSNQKIIVTFGEIEFFGEETGIWNESWIHAMKFNLNTSQSIAGYQISLNITKQIDMNPDYSDLRVLTNNTPKGVELWSCNETQNSHDIKLWVNLTLPNKNMVKTNGSIYLVWGNPSAKSNFDCNKTFAFWEDWENYPAGSDVTGEEGTGGWSSSCDGCANYVSHFFAWAYNPFSGARNLWFNDNGWNEEEQGYMEYSLTRWMLSSQKTLKHGVIGYRYIYNGTSNPDKHTWFSLWNMTSVAYNPIIFLRNVLADGESGTNAIDYDGMPQHLVSISPVKNNGWYRVNITWFNISAELPEGTRVCFSNSTLTKCKWKKWNEYSYPAPQAPNFISFRQYYQNSEPFGEQRYDNLFVANTSNQKLIVTFGEVETFGGEDETISLGAISMQTTIDPIENMTIQVEASVNATSLNFDAGRCKLYYPNSTLKEQNFAQETAINSSFTRLNCTFSMKYYHVNGTYNVTIIGNNTYGNYDQADRTFAYTLLDVFALNTTALDFGTLQVGQSNTKVFTMTNTGNKNLNLQMNGTDMTSGSDTIGVSNFTFDDDSDLSDGTVMSYSFQPFTALNILATATGYIKLSIPQATAIDAYSGTIGVKS
jgi:hypothetical protein